jgi:hypothetical protein
MFKPDRLFSQRNLATGGIDWYFHAREGTFGPYDSKAAAKKILDEFVALRVATNDDGGRAVKASSKLSLEAVEYGAVPRHYEPFQRKKGKDL